MATSVAVNIQARQSLPMPAETASRKGFAIEYPANRQKADTIDVRTKGSS
jgi:hypothetical protein